MKPVIACLMLAAVAGAQAPVVRTADPIKRGLKLTDFPRTVKVSDNVSPTRTSTAATKSSRRRTCSW
jgi:hypothetical protein